MRRSQIEVETKLVVQDKAKVTMKALSELIATKWDMINKTSEKDRVLGLIADAVANKGRHQPPSHHEPERRSESQKRSIVVKSHPPPVNKFG